MSSESEHEELSVENEQSEEYSDQERSEDKEKISAKEKHKQKKRQAEALRFKEDQDNRGIIYISKVPPFMKPEKVRFLMSQFGEVDRIYLTPEDPARQKARAKRGGTKKTCYLDGWVEFLDKKLAKRVAISLNGSPVGGGKRSFHSEFIWNIRYLSKFKWQHLTEHKRRQDQTRQDRVRTVLSQAKKDNEMYMKRVDQAKMINAMEAKKKDQQKEKQDLQRTEKLARKQLDDLRNKFRQRDVVEDLQPVKQSANIKLLNKAIRPAASAPAKKKQKT